MAISPELARIYSVAPADVYYIEAVSLYHSALAKPIHITNSTVDVKGEADSALVTFLSLPFSIKMPDKDTSGSQRMQVSFSAVEQNFLDDLENMARQPYESVDFRYRVFLSNQVNASGYHKEQLNPAWRYSISSFAVNNTEVLVTASKTNLHNRAWPKVLYNAQNFPGLDK